MFFQAEDGIRDGHVTGVQTCALPICPIGTEMPATSILVSTSARAGMKRPRRRPAIIASPIQTGSHLSNVDNCRLAAGAGAGEIGRASCRERGKSWVRPAPVDRQYDLE